MPITVLPPSPNKWEDALRKFVTTDIGHSVYSTSVAEKMAITQAKANAAAKWLAEIMGENGWR